MKRRPLRPSLQPLRRRTPIRSRTRLRQVNPERRDGLYAAQFGPHAERIRELPCILTGTAPPSDPHHVLARAAGGKWWHLVPLSRRSHIRWHALGELSLPAGWSRERLLEEALRLAWESYELGLVNEPPGEARQKGAQ